MPVVPRSDLHLPAVFRGRDAVAQGLLTAGQLRGPHVLRVLRGVYAPAGTLLTHRVRCAAAGLVIDPAAQITGTSMATVLGVPLARDRDEVSVVLPEASQQERYVGIAFRRVSAGLEPGRPWESTQLAHPCRMAFDLAARVPLTVAVGRLDAVVRAGLLDVDTLAAWLRGRRDNDVVAVRAAVAMVDGRAESLPESALRVELALAGIATVPQHTVTHLGRFVARVDLAVPDRRVAIEYDGAWHALREQLEADRRRLAALREAGWVVVHVTASMLRDPGQVVGTVQRALR
jgi:very-short-patch-repair endonuclease